MIAWARSRFGALQPELRQFLKISGLRVLLADDPAVALKRFLGRKGRGRPAADNQFRDCMIAADVAELVSAETTIDAACNTIGDAAGLSPEAVRKIYFAGRETLEVKIELGFRAEAGNTPPGRTR